MKKALTLVLALVMCLSVLSVAAFAAEYSYVSVTGTLNGWDPSNADFRMTESSANVYTLTKRLEAGSYEFKFTANGNWSDLDLGGAFMGSGVEGDLYWGGSNIGITVEEACDVTFVLDLTNFDGTNGAKFTVTIGDKVDKPADNIKVHVSVPAEWGDIYVYVWNPEHLGTWSGTKLEGEYLELPAAFGGMVINNGNGIQTVDILDIDLTKSEVWITVGAAGEDGKYAYTLSYETSADGGEVNPNNPPQTGDNIVAMVVAMMFAACGLIVMSKKRNF